MQQIEPNNRTPVDKKNGDKLTCRKTIEKDNLEKLSGYVLVTIIASRFKIWFHAGISAPEWNETVSTSYYPTPCFGMHQSMLYGSK